MYSTMVTCLSEELTRIGLALRHLAPVEGIIVQSTSNYKTMVMWLLAAVLTNAR
jgi:hypothetical protein